MTTHEKMYPILRYFEYAHLPEKLQAISKPFCDLAHQMALDLPYCPQTEAGLFLLLQAKDCAVRAALDLED